MKRALPWRCKARPSVAIAFARASQPDALIVKAEEQSLKLSIALKSLAAQGPGRRHSYSEGE